MANPYIDDTSERIAERDARAEKFLADKSDTYKNAARSGLRTADMYDRAGSTLTDERVRAGTGILGGAGGGFVGGILLGIAAIAITGATAATAMPLFLGVLGVSTVVGAAFYGVQNYKDTLNSGGRRRVAERADHMAEMAGAVPMQLPDMAHPDLLKLTGRDPDLIEKTDAYIKTGIPPVLLPVPPESPFTRRVEESRAAGTRERGGI